MTSAELQKIGFLRRIARDTRWWVALRRAQREGWRFSIKKFRTWPRILELPPVRTAINSDEARCEVHLLCSERDYLSAIWAIKSFYAQAENLLLPLIIHFDTTIPIKVFQRLQQHFPDARIIDRSEADAIVRPILEKRALFRLAAARQAGAFVLKLTDFALLGHSANIISFDSDVLFFSKPTEILQAASGDFSATFVQVDRSSVYNIGSARARALGWELPERVNTGIMAFARSTIDLDACDQLLADAELARTTGWIEQTLYALLFGRTGQLQFLPAPYTIPVPGDFRQNTNIIARHYAGESRPLLTLEGMPWFLEQARLRSE